ncbi:piggyBac transposable element-derived protein 5 isoform X2 [Gorilla gorilla gorilla]|uniref:piggyBac transposable element-derived protein 5 isoform X2 n=1 Tax=Gorilla gorilla gorilla TaxID=9595 RepID=UPI00300AE49E
MGACGAAGSDLQETSAAAAAAGVVTSGPPPTWSVSAAPGSEPPGRTAPWGCTRTAEGDSERGRSALRPRTRTAGSTRVALPSCSRVPPSPPRAARGGPGLRVPVGGDRHCRRRPSPFPPAPATRPAPRRRVGAFPAPGPPSSPAAVRAGLPIGRRAGGERRQGPPLAARAREGRQPSAGGRGEGGQGGGGRRGDAAGAVVAAAAAAPGLGRSLCVPPALGRPCQPRARLASRRGPQPAAPELRGRFPGRWARGGQDGGPAGHGAAGAVLRAALVGGGGPRRGPGARRVRLGGTVGGGRAGGGRGHGRGRRGRAEEGAGAARGCPRALREPAHLGRRVRRVRPGQRREPLLQHLGRLALLLGRLLGRRARAPGTPRGRPATAPRPGRTGVGGGRGRRGLERSAAGPPAPALRGHRRSHPKDAPQRQCRGLLPALCPRQRPQEHGGADKHVRQEVPGAVWERRSLGGGDADGDEGVPGLHDLHQHLPLRVRPQHLERRLLQQPQPRPRHEPGPLREDPQVLPRRGLPLQPDHARALQGPALPRLPAEQLRLCLQAFPNAGAT